MQAIDWSLYVIIDRRAAGERPLTEVAAAAIAGGATVIQLRDKVADTHDMIATAQALHKLTQRAGIPLIINDRVDVALAVDAEGVHVGPEDMPLPLARRLMRPERIVGFSAGTVAEARQAEREGADYLGTGDVYGTGNKPDAGVPIGVEGLAEITNMVSIPVVGVGGITLDNTPAVIKAGAAGVAVISAVAGAEDPEQVARALRKAINAQRARCEARSDTFDTTSIAGALSRIRQERPLIHHITNLVVMNDTANVTLHIGALPVMAHAAEEVAEMTAQASALVLNLGTLTLARLEAMRIAGRKANALGIPIVLDPVGVGATKLRTEAAQCLLDELRIAIVCGNAGEVGALSGVGGGVKGVESVEDLDDPVAVAQVMARKWDTVVAITGERDFISDGRRVLGVNNGHHWLTTVTGTGCMATTMIAAFAAVHKDYVGAAAGGLAAFGLAAERAAKGIQGPGSFKVALLDQIYNLTSEVLAQGARIITLIP